MYSRKRRRKIRFLITAGGTREYIDPVRFISNASSGKMGYELAKSAIAAGHNVTLITAPTSLEIPKKASVIKVESAREMFKSVKEEFNGCDCLIMTAAVSDYTPVKSARHKMKKSSKGITLKLKPTQDILKWAGNHKKRNQAVVGFALEDKDIKTGAQRKMHEKKLDMVIANTPSAIGSERSKIQIKKNGGKWREFSDMPKKQAARKLIQLIEQSI